MSPGGLRPVRGGILVGSRIVKKIRTPEGWNLVKTGKVYPALKFTLSTPQAYRRVPLRGASECSE